ncbi:class II aldolase/adducin family protein [Francisella hispaniensis]|uniref:class II aldolase/adducin family protein n=1 Tax=Francisella hispaniensis TaxID=622488 RepID=UPI001907917C|nr:class II aldolase/adducin family protein [Francisella hispaniensis]MBK2356533.1 class II aldolase/adducin family protein [Francisella hispaniensis]
MSTEKILRKKLAICHHVIHYYGWDDLLATHISARLPNGNIIITPHNVTFDKVTKKNIVTIKPNGEILSENGYKVMPQAANIHLETYNARKDINAIIHTHSKYAVIISSLECGMQFTNQQSLRFYDDVSYHHYDGLALDNEGKAIAASLGAKNSMMILDNHGIITTAESIEKAIYKHYYFEKAIEIEVKTLATGQKIRQIPQEICKKTAAQFAKINTCHLEFEVFKTLTKSYR